MSAWSPNDEEKLLSVSYDGTAQIWDVVKACGLANFRDHISRVFCGIWSPFNKDVVLTGGEDAMLIAWDVTKQSEKIPTKKPTKFKTVREKQATMVDDDSSQEPVKELLETLQKKKAELIQQNLKEKSCKLDKKSYFGLSISQEVQNRNSAYSDLDILANPDASINVEETPHLGIFTQKKNILDEIIDKEISLGTLMIDNRQ